MFVRKQHFVILAAMLLSLPSAYAHQGHCKDTILGEQMVVMKKAMKKMASDAKQKDVSQFSSYVATLREAAKQSRAEQPMMLAEQPQQKREAFMQDYQKGMDELLDMLDKVDQALANDERKEALGLVKKIGRHSKASHKEFRLEC